MSPVVAPRASTLHSRAGITLGVPQSKRARRVHIRARLCGKEEARVEVTLACSYVLPSHRYLRGEAEECLHDGAGEPAMLFHDATEPGQRSTVQILAAFEEPLHLRQRLP